MVELDDAMRRALLAREDPPSEARDAILANLRSQLGGPIDPGSGESGPGSPDGIGLAAASEGARMVWLAKVVAATVGLTTGGLLTLKLGAMAILGVSDDDEGRPQVAIEVVEPERTTVPEPKPTLPEATSTIEPESAPTPVETSEPRSVDAGEPDDDASTLAAELALVRAAKQVRADDRDAALAQLELHRERFAKGVLAPEREALRIELLCELGRDLEAERARERFVIDFADSPLRARVLAACTNVGTDSKRSGDLSR